MTSGRVAGRVILAWDWNLLVTRPGSVRRKTHGSAVDRDSGNGECSQRPQYPPSRGWPGRI